MYHWFSEMCVYRVWCFESECEFGTRLKSPKISQEFTVNRQCHTCSRRYLFCVTAACFQAGFIVDDVALVPRPTILPAGTGMRGWLSTFTLAFINAIPLQESEDPSGEAAGTTPSVGVP